MPTTSPCQLEPNLCAPDPICPQIEGRHAACHDPVRILLRLEGPSVPYLLVQCCQSVPWPAMPRLLCVPARHQQQRDHLLEMPWQETRQLVWQPFQNWRSLERSKRLSTFPLSHLLPDSQGQSLHRGYPAIQGRRFQQFELSGPWIR